MKCTRKQARNQKDWIFLLFMSTAFAAVFMNVQGFISLLPLVQEDLHVSITQIGLYSSFYFASATLIAVFSGRIVDHLGTKKGLVIGVVVVGTMMLLHSVSPSFWIILIFAFFTGFAFSIISPSVNKGVVELIDSSKRSLYIGIVYGGGGFGSFLGATIFPFFGKILGWRTAILIGSLFAFTVALFVLRFYRTGIVRTEDENHSTEGGVTSLKEDLVLFFGNRYLLCVCGMGIVFGMSISSVTGHFHVYLVKDLGFSITFAGFGLGIFHIGGIIGQPVWGLINETVFRGDRRKGLFLLGMIISFIDLFWGLGASMFSFHHYFILLLSFLLGFCTMGIITIYFTTVSEAVSKEHIGGATGIATIFTRIGMVFTPYLFGLIADYSRTYSYSWIVLGTTVFFVSVAFFLLSAKHSPFAS